MSKASAPSRRERVELGIYRRTTGSGQRALEIGFRDAQGRQRWRRVEGGITAARAALAEAHAARGKGQRLATDPRLQFDVAAEAWWQARATKLRPATQSAYGAGLEHLRRDFGGRRMADITAADVAAFITRQKRAGLKGWTIKGHLTVLSSIFRHAARHLGLVIPSPVSLLDRVERPSCDDERPKRILSPEELGRLLDAVDAPYRPVFVLAAETGGRLGESSRTLVGRR